MSEPTPKLNAAIAAVMAKVKRLEKGDRNNFGKYAYTSVDDFKDAVRPLLAEAGITIHATEVGTVETIELTKTDDSGRQTKSVVAKYVFSFTLEHNSGEKGSPEQSTVMLPYTGAQTTGAARSYAIKEWLKSRLLMSSGDLDDADSHPQHNYSSKAPTPAKNGTHDLTGNPDVKGYKPPATSNSQAAQDARAAAEYFKKIEREISELKTEGDLDDWYALNREEMNARLAKSYVPTVRDMLADKREELATALVPA